MKNRQLHLAVVGANVRTASLAHLEQLATSGFGSMATLGHVRSRRADLEVALLSTCNRTEWYLASEDDPVEAFRDVLADGVVTDPSDAGWTFEARDGEAARHIFRVSCGLESSVFGDAQIVSQLGLALTSAASAGTARVGINDVFTRAIRLGRDARRQFGLDKIATSAGDAAARMVLDRWSSAGTGSGSVLVIGTGAMAKRVVAATLRRPGVHVSIVGRRYQATESVARRWCAEPHEWDELAGLMGRVDTVVAATSAPHMVVTRELVEATGPREVGSLLLVDLGLPRNIDPDAGRLPGVELVDLIGIGAGVESALGRVEDHRRQLEQLVDDATREWAQTSASAGIEAIISDLYRQIPEFVERVTARVNDPAACEEQHRRALATEVKRLLDGPVRRLRGESVRTGNHLR